MTDMQCTWPSLCCVHFQIALVKRNRDQLMMGLSPVLPSPRLHCAHSFPVKVGSSGAVGVTSGNGENPAGVRLICQRHLLEALKTTHPSLSDRERKRFETMCVGLIVPSGTGVVLIACSPLHCSCQRFLTGVQSETIHDYLSQKSTHA